MPRAPMWPPTVLRRAATPASEPTNRRKGCVMSQIMYNYPAMLAHSADMAGYAGTLQSLGADISAEQAALQAGWRGGTGVRYQAWQAPGEQAVGQVGVVYRAGGGSPGKKNTPLP